MERLTWQYAVAMREAENRNTAQKKMEPPSTRKRLVNKEPINRKLAVPSNMLAPDALSQKATRATRAEFSGLGLDSGW